MPFTGLFTLSQPKRPGTLAAQWRATAVSRRQLGNRLVSKGDSSTGRPTALGSLFSPPVVAVVIRPIRDLDGPVLSDRATKSADLAKHARRGHPAPQLR